MSSNSSPSDAAVSAPSDPSEPVVFQAPNDTAKAAPPTPPAPAVDDVFLRAAGSASTIPAVESPESVKATTAAAPPASAPAAVDKVAFRDLFQFATAEEIWLMRFSCLCAAGLGLVFPLFTILFGDLLNSLNGVRALSDVASDFSLKFLIIALCAGFGGSVSYGLPVYVAERQMKRVRELYLGSILRQEPAWFDVNKPGEASSRPSLNPFFVTLYPGELASRRGHALLAERHRRQVHSSFRQSRRLRRIHRHWLQFKLADSTLRAGHLSRHYGNHDIPQSRHRHRRKARVRRLRGRWRLQHRDIQQHPHGCRLLLRGCRGQEVHRLPREGQGCEQDQRVEHGSRCRLPLFLHIRGLCWRHVRFLPFALRLCMHLTTDLS
jgi:hypothetical protein